MTRHFSDPYVAAIYATLTSSPRGCARAELLAENPEEIAGDFNAALRELHRAGLTAVAAGRYIALSKPMPPREEKTAAQPNADAQVAEAATPGNQTSGVATPDASAPPPAKRGRPRKSNADKGPLAAAFVADMRAMSAATEEPPPPQEKDTPMPKKTRSNPQETVLAALKSSGTNSNAGLVAALEGELDGKQISNALYNLNKAGKVIIGEEAGRRVYTAASETAKPPRKPAKTAAKRVAAAGRTKAPSKRKSPRRAASRDTRSIEEINAAARKAASRAVAIPAAREPEVLPRPVYAPEGFRCGLFSDGGLAIVAGDTEMQLDAVQTRALIGFLEHTTVLRAPA